MLEDPDRGPEEEPSGLADDTGNTPGDEPSGLTVEAATRLLMSQAGSAGPPQAGGGMHHHPKQTGETPQMGVRTMQPQKQMRAWESHQADDLLCGGTTPQNNLQTKSPARALKQKIREDGCSGIAVK